MIKAYAIWSLPIEPLEFFTISPQLIFTPSSLSFFIANFAKSFLLSCNVFIIEFNSLSSGSKKYANRWILELFTELDNSIPGTIFKLLFLDLLIIELAFF